MTMVTTIHRHKHWLRHGQSVYRRVRPKPNDVSQYRANGRGKCWSSMCIPARTPMTTSRSPDTTRPFEERVAPPGEDDVCRHSFAFFLLECERIKTSKIQWVLHSVCNRHWEQVVCVKYTNLPGAGGVGVLENRSCFYVRMICDKKPWCQMQPLPLVPIRSLPSRIKTHT